MPTGVRITLASPDQIRSWSSGEVTEPVTIHFRTWKPEPRGLFSERIFGPVKSWTCACGKYKREPGFRCKKCGVEVAHRDVRRERMGHIELAAPVAHTWFARRSPNVLALLLDLSARSVGSILAYGSYLVQALDEEKRAHLLAQPSDEEER